MFIQQSKKKRLHVNLTIDPGKKGDGGNAGECKILLKALWWICMWHKMWADGYTILEKWSESMQIYQNMQIGYALWILFSSEWFRIYIFIRVRKYMNRNAYLHRRPCYRYYPEILSVYLINKHWLGIRDIAFINKCLVGK